jgi:hypothetical protein
MPLKFSYSLILVATLAVLLLGSGVAWGEDEEMPLGLPRPQFRVGASQFRDSEDYTETRGHISAKFFVAKTFSVEVDAARDAFSRVTDVNGNGVDVVLGGSLGPLPEVRFGGGVTKYDSIGTKPSGLVSVSLNLMETNNVTLSYTHDQVVYDAKSLESLKKALDSDEFDPSFYQYISENWSVWMGLGYGLYSDKNSRISFNASLTYLFRPEPMFGLAYAVTYIGYDKRSENYWDPENYQSHGLMLWLDQPLGKLFSIEFRACPGYSFSEKKPNAWTSLLMDFHPSPHWGVEANGYFMGNSARGGGYDSSTLSLDLMLSP